MGARLKISYVSAAAVAAFVVTLGVVTPAFADDPTDGIADAVAALVDSAAPSGELAAPGEQSQDEVTVTAGTVETSVPFDPADDIIVRASIDGEVVPVAIQLPDEMSLGAGQVAEDGTVVYADDDLTGDAVAVQTLADGSTRVQTIVASLDSPHEFGYGLEGYSAAVNDEGTAAFISADGAFVPVAAAWAVDANGKDVRTYYRVDGDQLVQIIVPDASTAYAVVADPSGVWVGAGWGMKLTRSETSSVRNYAAAGGMCAMLARATPVGAIACGVLTSYMQLQANLAESDKPKTCLFSQRGSCAR